MPADRDLGDSAASRTGQVHSATPTGWDLDVSSAARAGRVHAAVRQRDVSQVSRFVSNFKVEPEPAVRAWMVRGAGQLGGPQGLPLFEQALQDPSAEVRAAGVVALGELGNDEAEAALIVALATESVSGVRQAIVFRLSGFKSSQAVDALGRALAEDMDPSVRAEAAESLEAIGTTAARGLLKKARNDADARVRRAAQADAKVRRAGR